MNLNRKILYIGLGLMLFTIVISIGFTYYTTIKAPVFLRNCIEAPIPNQENIPNSQILIELNYITKSTDQNSVVGISFPEEPEMIFSATENGYNFFNFNQNQQSTLGSIYGRYSIRTVYVYLDRFDQKEWFGEKELLQAEIQFSDGSSLSTDLGVIILYRDKFDNQDVITRQSTSSTNDGTSSNRYHLNETINLQYVKSNTLNLATDLIELKIEGVDYKDFPFPDFSNSRKLTITSKFSNLQSNKSSYDTYDLKPKLYYETQEGAFEYIRINNIMQKRWFNSYKDIIMYLSERGVY